MVPYLVKGCGPKERAFSGLGKTIFTHNVFPVMYLMIKNVESGDVKSVENFLSSHDHEIDLNQEWNGVTPLLVASKCGHLDIIELLLQKGAEVDFQTGKGVCALMKAFEVRKAEVVKLLIENGAQRSINIGEKFLLTISCEEGDVEMVKALLAKGVHINPSDFPSHNLSVEGRGWYYSYVASPVNTAVDCGHFELVEWLLEQDVEVPSGALFLAISKKNSKMVEILLKYSAEVNVEGKCGWTALMQASYYGKSSIVKMLLGNGAKVDLQTTAKTEMRYVISLYETEEFALALAAERAYVDVVRLLLEGGAQVNLKGSGGCTALHKVLHYAVSKQRLIDTVELLLERGAEVNLPDDQGCTAFMTAVELAPPKIVELFLGAGAVIQTIQWKTLRYLVASPRIEVVRILLEGGLDINRQDENGKSLLMHAIGAEYYNIEVGRLLLQQGANIDLQDNGGSYALLNVVDIGMYEVAELLLGYDANANLRDDNSRSALSVLLQRVESGMVG